MACKYWYDGSWRTEQEFKSILNNGLLDQLLNGEIISLKEFQLDETKILNKKTESISEGPVEVRIKRKIQRNLNVGRDPNKHGEPLKNNPLALLQQAANTRGDKNNKLQLVIKTIDRVNLGQSQEGDTILSTIHTGLHGTKIATDLKKELENSKVNLSESLEPGYVYMLIPSAYGLYPVKLFTHLIKDTKDFDTLKTKLKELQEATEPLEIQNIRTVLEDLLYRFKIEYKKGNTKKDSVFNLEWTEVEGDRIVPYDLQIPGDQIDVAIDFLGNRIRKVDFSRINTGNYNQEIAESGAITTDLFHDNGNFFHSSSFFLETFQLSENEKENYKKQVLEFEKSDTTNFNEEFGPSSKEAFEPNPNENSTKEEESEIFNKEIPEEGYSEEDLELALLSAQASKTAADKKKGKVEEKKEGLKREDVIDTGKEELSPEDLAEIEAASQIAEEQGISKGLEALEQEAAATEIIDANAETGEDIDTDISSTQDDIGDPFGDANLKTKMGPKKADTPIAYTLGGKPVFETKEDSKKASKEAREEGWKTLKRILGENAVRQSGKKGTVRHIKRFESLEHYLPKESYEMLVEALKHGDELYGLFTTAAILISELAPIGTEAHEAFHVIFNLVLPLEQRFKILNEIFYKYQDEIPLKREEITLEDGTKKIQYVRPTFIQLEEFLADKFMAYEQSQEVDKLKPVSKQPAPKDKRTPKELTKDILAGKENFKNTNAFFKGLSRMLRAFFKKNRALNIDNLFENINLGVYASSIEFKNTVLKRSVRQSIGRSVRETAPNRKYINPIEKKWALRYFNSKIKKAIEGFRQQLDPKNKLSIPEIINLIGKKSKNSGPHIIFSNAITDVVRDIAIAKQLLAQAEAAGDTKKVTKFKNLIHHFSKFYKIITNNQKIVRKNNKGRIEFMKSSDLLEQFNRFLKNNEGIEINYGGYEAETRSPQEGTSGEVTEQDYINAIEEGEDTPDRVAQLNSIERNPKQGMKQQLISFFANIPKYNSDGSKAISPFGIQDMEDSNVVFAALVSQVSNSYTLEEFDKKLNKLNKPWKNDIITLFANNPRLRTLFFANFGSKNYAQFESVYEVNGEFRVFTSNSKTIKDIISEDLIANFLSTTNPLYKSGKTAANWTDNIDPQKAKIFLDNILKIDYIYRQRDVSADEKVAKSNVEFFESGVLFEELSKVLNSININLNADQIRKIYESGGENFAYKRAKIGNLIKILQDIGKKLVGTNQATISSVRKGNKNILTPKYTRDATKRINPFTNLLPETDIAYRKKKDSGKSLVESLAMAIEPALNAELVSSFRGIGGKTKYNIILSGQINKMLEQFTDPDQLEDFIKNKTQQDLLLNGLPILQDLKHDDNFRNNFKPIILDGLTRKGQNKSIPYDKMSDIELEATSFGLFYRRGKREYQQGRVLIKLGIPSDSPTAHYIRTKKLSKDEIIDKLTETGIAELDKINFIKKLKRDNPTHPILRNKNYAERGDKFQLLTFLNKVPFNTLNKETIKTEIENFLKFDLSKDNFFTKQIKKYQESGIIQGVQNDLIVFNSNILDSSLNTTQKQNEVFMEYLLNTYYYNLQTNVLFAGDPSFYKNTEDYQKRFKQIFSPGTYTTLTGSYGAIIVEDSMVPTSKENLKHINDIIDKSDLTAVEKEALRIIWKEKADINVKKNQNNESDGGTIVSLDFRKKILQGLGEWGKAHDEAYKRIKQGNETIEDLRIIDPPASPLKPFTFTHININGIQVPFQIKNAETVLTKSFAYKKDKKGNLVYPKLAAIYEDMEKGVYEVALFESAVKVGGIANKADNRFTHYEETNDGTYKPSVGYDGMKVLQLNISDYRKQQETPAHHIDERSNFGSQLRTLIISDINLQGTYELNLNGEEINLKGFQIVEMYQDIILDDLKESFESIEKEIVNSDGTLNYVKLIPLLREHAIERNMGDQYLQAIAPVEVTINDEILGQTRKTITTALPLFHPRILYQTESLLHSIFRNNVVKQKIKGGSLVNTPSYGVSTLKEEGLDTIDEKYHPKLKIKNGKIIWQVLMPHTSKKFFPTNKKGEVDFQYIKQYAPELLEIIANRIPTEDKYSMFNIEVIGFTPPSMANSIIMPPEITTIAGLDFDIDKLYFLAKQFKIIDNIPGQQKSIKITKYYNTLDNKSQALDLAENIFGNKILLRKFVKENFSKTTDQENFINKVENSIQEVALAKKDKNRSIADIKREIRKGENELKNARELKTQDASRLRKELQETIDEFRDILKEVEWDDELVEKSIALQEAEEGKNIILDQIANQLLENTALNISSYNTRAARDNQKINILKSILENRHTAAAIINPGNFESLKHSAARIRLLRADKIKEAKLKGKALLEAAAKLDENEDFNIAYPSTQLELFRRNMDGMDLIGIMANHNTHHAKAQYTNLKLKNSLTFNGDTYQALNQTKSKSGKRISRILATKLAAVVDNAKDPISSFLNFNTITANVVALADRLGVEEDFMFALLNQPIILELTRQVRNEQGSMSKEKLINQIKKDLLKELNKEIPADTKVKKISIEDLTTELLESTLSNKKGVKRAMIQKAALGLFEQLNEIGEELSRGIRASKTDSITSYGATGASDWVFLNNQKRILKDKEFGTNNIVGLDEIFLPLTSTQVMNPAFTTYGLYKPIGIYEKIFPTIGKLDESDPTNISLSPLGLVKEKFTEFKPSGVLTAEEAQMINSNYLNYTASEFKFFHHNQAKDILGKFPGELLKFKRNLPQDSPFKPLMDQLHIVRPDIISPITRIEFYQTGKFADDIEALSDSWERMLLDSDPKNVEIAKKLIKYAFFANGFNFGPYTFANVIPVKFFTNEYQSTQSDLIIQDGGGQLTLNELLQKRLLSNNYDSEYNGRYIEQFIRNFSGRHQFIPTVKIDKVLDEKTELEYLTPDGKITVDFYESPQNIVKDTEGNLVIIGNSATKHLRNRINEPITFIKSFDTKVTSHYSTNIYKLVDTQIVYGKANQEIPIYKYIRIPNLGINNVALEFDALNNIEESVKPSPEDIKKKTEAKKLADQAIDAEIANNQKNSAQTSKTYTPEIDPKAGPTPVNLTTDTGMYRLQYKNSEFMVEVKNGVFQIFNAKNMEQKFVGKTPENDPVVKELYSMFKQKIGGISETLVENYHKDIDWQMLAVNFDRKFFDPKKIKGTQDILRNFWPYLEKDSNIAKLVAKLGQVNFEVKFLNNEEWAKETKNSRGSTYMFYWDGAIYLNEERIRQTESGSFYLYAILHEIIHAYTIATSFGVRTTTKDGKTESFAITELKDPRLKELFNEAKNLDTMSGSPKNLYGFTNELEFVAEIFTDPEFAEHIKTLKAPQESKSIWEKFIDWVTSLFVKKSNTTRGKEIYDESMKLINAIVENVTKDYKDRIQREKEEIEAYNKKRQKQQGGIVEELNLWSTQNEKFIIWEIDNDGEGNMYSDIVDYLYGIKTVNGTNTKTIMSETDWNSLSPEEKYNVIKCN
ncbi:MAG: hypothetical protein V3V33_02055 [Candidatus Lokiarchaeia archaeon]